MSDPKGLWPLADRTALPEDFVWLRDAFPRSRWGEAAVPQTASHWLAMHDGFRQADRFMDQVVSAYRAGVIDIRTFHDRLLPALAKFLQHLDGHHNIETTHYFPIFRQIEPRIAQGIDLLDRDHDEIHFRLEALAEAGNAMHRVVLASARDAGDQASRLIDSLSFAGPALSRHLLDEEDIVIPLLSTKGG